AATVHQWTARRLPGFRSKSQPSRPRQIYAPLALARKHRGYQKALAREVLVVDRPGPCIIRIVDDHGPKRRNTRLVIANKSGIQIRDKLHAHLDETPTDGFYFFPALGKFPGV